MTEHLKKFIPVEGSRCFLCVLEENEPAYIDLVGLLIGAHRIVICNSHALDLVNILLDRFYPVWGDGPLFDKIKQ